MVKNKVILAGTIITDPEEIKSEVTGEKFIYLHVEVKRRSGVNDYIRAVIPQIILCNNLQNKNAKNNNVFLAAGERIKITGSLRARNLEDKKEFYIFAENAEKAGGDDINEVYIDGILCNNPKVRTTLTGRVISDLVIVTKRNYNRYDYINAIAWGRNAVICSTQKQGSKIILEGKIQSRQYIKVGDDGTETTYNVNELSVSTIKKWTS